jgi:hypothetical protein
VGNCPSIAATSIGSLEIEATRSVIDDYFLSDSVDAASCTGPSLRDLWRDLGKALSHIMLSLTDAILSTAGENWFWPTFRDRF